MVLQKRPQSLLELILWWETEQNIIISKAEMHALLCFPLNPELEEFQTYAGTNYNSA